MTSDLRTPIAKARDNLMLGKEGERWCYALGISTPKRINSYLRNRIEAAIIAGWNACEQENNRDAE